MSKIEFARANAADSRLQTLLNRHREYARSHTPPDSGHAVDPNDSGLSDFQYWIATAGDQVIGCIGLKPLAPDYGEIKSMHVLQEYRGRGVADELIRLLETRAQDLKLARLVLETGQSEGFAASRRFYKRMGFEPCAAFGPYAQDPFSYCMQKSLL